jgi:hypothetical protein
MSSLIRYWQLAAMTQGIYKSIANAQSHLENLPVVNLTKS